ncbi:MAG TPA: ABC transporter permease [Anaerolineae bacterium]|nr:ABC transporter permease [Anaerolineae bacterium]
MIEIRWDWIAGHLDDVAEKTWQHLQLLVIPMLAGFAIAFALAVLALRRPGTIGPVTAVTGLLYTIPSLAAFAVLIPITGLSLMTAIIPLTTYTLLILYVNTVAGLRSVPAEVNEAADAMGYTAGSRLWHVQLPLAVPLIMAGVRVAAVTTIGLVTVAAIIGGNRFGGLGQFITEGLQTDFDTKIYLGAIGSVILAFVVDGVLVGVQRLLTPWSRARGREG